MAVLVIMGILSAVAVKKVYLYSDIADRRGIEAAVSALNVEEVEAWVTVKFGHGGWTNDLTVFNLADRTLSDDYHWTDGPGQDGGSLRFNRTALGLTRIRSTDESWGRWKI
jgi:hypothetical protein